jgi:hypothetical protein
MRLESLRLTITRLGYRFLYIDTSSQDANETTFDRTCTQYIVTGTYNEPPRFKNLFTIGICNIYCVEQHQQRVWIEHGIEFHFQKVKEGSVLFAAPIHHQKAQAKLLILLTKHEIRNQRSSRPSLRQHSAPHCSLPSSSTCVDSPLLAPRRHS